MTNINNANINTEFDFRNVIAELQLNPPQNLESVNDLMIKTFGRYFNGLTFINNESTRTLYLNQSRNNNSHPDHEAQCYFSSIGHFSAHSGVKFAGTDCGVCHPNLSVFCNGTSSSGKTNAMAYTQAG